MRRTEEDFLAMIETLSDPAHRRFAARIIWWDNVDDIPGGLPRLYKIVEQYHQDLKTQLPHETRIQILTQCGYTRIQALKRCCAKELNRTTPRKPYTRSHLRMP
jgi:hypothetical protein